MRRSLLLSALLLPGAAALLPGPNPSLSTAQVTSTLLGNATTGKVTSAGTGSPNRLLFTNPGTSEMHFVAALDSEPRMRAVLTLFEGVATGAADGYGRMLDRPAARHLGPAGERSLLLSDVAAHVGR